MLGVSARRYGLIDANKAVLPKAAFESAQAHGNPIATDPDDGFKRVA